MKQWTFFTNHSHILFYIHDHPHLTMKEIAAQVGITERAVHRIISDLEAEGYLEVSKDGRRNLYSINHKLPLRHENESHRTIGELLEFISTEVE
jgi:DNA-binding MarR family transcriptional regulator